MTDRTALLAAADGFVPEIKARAGEFERLRRIPADLSARLAAAQAAPQCSMPPRPRACSSWPWTKLR